MSKETIGERLAELETKMEFLLHENVELKGKLQDIIESQSNMLAEMSRYKGFIGGIMFVGGCLWAFIKLAAPILFKLKGG